MDQIKMIVVKTLDDCISWTPKFADFFFGNTFFDQPNYFFIFGKKSLQTVPFLKALNEKYPLKCLVLSRNFPFPKLISNIKISKSKNQPGDTKWTLSNGYNNVGGGESVYWVLGGKTVFSLFDKLVGEIISVNIQINSIAHPDALFYNFPKDNFEMVKIAQKNFDYYKQKIGYDISTFQNTMSSFHGWVSQENEYLRIGKKILQQPADILFSEKINIDLSRDNFPILTTREILLDNFVEESINLYNQYIDIFKTNYSHNQLVKNGQHLIQFYPHDIFYDNVNNYVPQNNNLGLCPMSANRTFIKVLSLQVYIPECKFFEQLPYDISMYCLFLILLCQHSKNMQPGHIHLILGKIHCPTETRELVEEQVKRCPLPFPVLKLNIDENEKIKVTLDNYYYWPFIE